MYHRYRVNEKRAMSPFGTKKGTSETYLLHCVFNHYKPCASDKIQLQDDAAEKLMEDLPQYKDCFVYHDEPLYITKDKRKYIILFRLQWPNNNRWTCRGGNFRWKSK